MRLTKLVIFAVLFSVLSVFASAATDLSISTSAPNVAYNQTITAFVDIITSEKISSLQLNLRYDNTKLQVLSITEGGFLSQGGASIADFSLNDSVNGEAEIVMFRNDATNTTGSGHIAAITFRALDKNNVTNLTLDGISISDSEAVSHAINSITNGTINFKTIYPIIISEVMKNPQNIIDLDGEYVELYNPNSFPVNIDGWTLKDADSDSHVINAGSALVVLPNDYAVLCRNDNTLANGNVNCDYEYSGFVLDDLTDEVILLNEGSHEVDRVDYTNVFPQTVGKSMELGSLTIDNNVAANWRDATVPLFSGDKGTPGMDNIVLNGPVITNFQKSPEPSNEDQDVTVSALITDFVPLTNVSIIADFEGVEKTYPVTQNNGSIYSFTIDDAFLENKETVHYQWFAKDNEGFQTAASAPAFTISNRAPVLVSNILPINFPEDSIQFINISANFEDLDGDMISFLSVDSDKIFIQPSNNFSGSYILMPDEDFTGNETVVFGVVDQYGSTAFSNPVKINVTPVNDAPTFVDLPVNLNTSEETPITFTVLASDIDHDPLTFYVNDADFSVNGNQITYTPAADYEGIKAFQVIVSDGQVNITQGSFINVIGSNDAPVINAIPAQNAVEETDLSLVLTPYLSDLESDVSLLTISESSPYASIIGQTITFNYPNGILHDNVTIIVSDGSASKKANISVAVANTNDNPVLSAIPQQTVLEEATLTLQLVANDPDPVHDVLTYSTTAAFGSLNTATGAFSWTPQTADIGTHTADFTVSDGNGGLNTKTATIQVTSVLQIIKVDVMVDGVTTTNVAPNGMVNVKPSSVVQVAVVLSNKANESLFGIDTDGTLDTTPMQQDSVFTTQLNSNTNATIVLDFIVPTIIDSGVYELNLASAGVTQTLDSRTAEQKLLINVQKNLHDIVLNNVSFVSNNLQCVRESDLFVALTNVGEHNESITLTVTNAALGVNVVQGPFQINENTPGSTTVHVNVPGAAKGSYVFDVNASYFFGTVSTKKQATLVIGNCAPTFNPITPVEPIQATELALVTFQINAMDSDGDSLTFKSNKSGVSIVPLGPTSAKVSWVPQHSDIGLKQISFNVTDGIGVDTEVASINVTNINDAPTIDSFSPSFDPIILEDAGTVQQFSIVASDLDNDPLEYEWRVDGGLPVDVSDSFTFVADGTVKSYTIEVKVTDGTFTATKQWTLTTTNEPLTQDFDVFNYDGSPSSATNVIISNEFGQINISGPVDLGQIADLDRLAMIQPGAAGINVSAAPQLNKPATITLFGLAFVLTPPIYENNNFQVSGTTACSVCSSIDYTDQTLTFDASSMKTFFVPVSNRNPSIASSPKTLTNINEQYSYDVQANDLDNDTLTYSLTAAPSGMAINSANGLITWTPTNFSTEQVSVLVVDGKGGQATQSFSVQVIEPPKLAISDLDVKVDGETDKNLEDGDTISKEAIPGSEIEFTIEIENLFDEDSDVDIEDIQMDVTIFDIDDDDDLEEEVDEFDLKADDKETVKVDFTIPYEVEDDTYDVLIEVEGTDQNDKEHRLEVNLKLEVEKEEHEIRIIEASALPSTMSCERTVTFRAEIVNTGEEDEEDISLEIRNDDLDISEEVSGIELDSGTNDNRYSKTFTKTLDEDIASGVYPVDFTVYYDGSESNTETIELNVGACVGQSSVTERPRTTTTTHVDENVNVVRPNAIVPGPITATQSTETGWFNWDTYTLLVIILLIIFVGLTIFIIGAAIILLTR